MSLPEKLKTLREEKGLTRKAAAEQAGVSITTYSGYENGKRTPKPETLVKLAKVFDCPVNELAAEAAAPAPAAAAEARQAAVEPAAPAAEEKPQRVKKAAKPKTAPKKSGNGTKKRMPTTKKVNMTAQLQFAGNSVDLNEIMEKGKAIAGGKPIDLYIKPEENTVYYVADGEAGSFPIV